LARWHPVDNLLATVWLFPKPGTKEPMAEIRYLPVTLDGVEVWHFRAVLIDVKTRRLVGDGYFPTLEAAAEACHRHALHAAVPPQMNETRR
jgi:hypothetical protein